MTAMLARARNSMTQVTAARAEGTRRRSSHSSTGTSAIAITSAAVTGMKNSAPARSANGRASASAVPQIKVSEASSRSRR
jgi:hypothetical protein